MYFSMYLFKEGIVKEAVHSFLQSSYMGPTPPRPFPTTVDTAAMVPFPSLILLLFSVQQERKWGPKADDSKKSWYSSLKFSMFQIVITSR
jgi:hypothetical protein